MIGKLLRKLRGIKDDDQTYANRFLKFYYRNHKRLIKERRSLYKDKRKKGICVRCTQQVIPRIIFCPYHRQKQQGYNHKARIHKS